MRVNLTIVNRSPNMKMLTAATIATFFLTGTSAQESEQKCFACGPESAQWYPNIVEPKSCDNFTESDDFSVDCGNDYNYCGITTDLKSKVISRICSKKLTEDCAVEHDTNEQYLRVICTCNGTLCNGLTLGEELEKATDPENIKSMNMSDNIPVEVVESTISPEGMVNDEPQKPLILDGDNKPNNSNIRIMMENSNHETPASHALPSPAALGQDGKPISQQGAPVDDEEDTLEGSGSNPTTTTAVPTTLETHTTTTAAPENGASCLHNNVILMSIAWTIGVAYALY